MVQFLKFKFLNIIKLNFNGVQFYKKILNFNYFKKIVNLAEILSLKLKMVNICVENFCVENFEWVENKYKDR